MTVGSIGQQSKPDVHLEVTAKQRRHGRAGPVRGQPLSESPEPASRQDSIAVVAVVGGWLRSASIHSRGRPDVFIFMAGKLSDFSDVMPGIMEEFLQAAHTGRPIYLFGGLGGASGVSGL